MHTTHARAQALSLSLYQILNLQRSIPHPQSLAPLPLTRPPSPPSHSPLPRPRAQSLPPSKQVHFVLSANKANTPRVGSYTLVVTCRMWCTFVSADTAISVQKPARAPKVYPGGGKMEDTRGWESVGKMIRNADCCCRLCVRWATCWPSTRMVR